MSQLVIPVGQPPRISKARSALDVSAKIWFGVALVGQGLFAFYILFVYLTPLFSDISLNGLTMAKGHSVLKGSDYSVLFVHILPAALLALSGLLQLVPRIRTRFPDFHRWNGRSFFVLGLSGALTGLYLTWFAMPDGGSLGALGITLNGVLIPIAIGLAWMNAIKRRFEQHMRWAVHSFLLVNGVWTFRLYMMGWYIVNQGPNGNNADLTGPADIAISFGCYLIPMAIAELYFWAKRQKKTTNIWLGVITLSFGVLATAIGTIAASMFLWIPPIKSLLGIMFS